MPWLSIVLVLLSFFMSKKGGASNEKAMVTAGLVGAGSYLVTHETDWGSANLGDLDGVTSVPRVDATGSPVLDSTGSQIIDTTGKVLSSWGGTGTAAVIGTTALATGGGGAIGSFLKDNASLLLIAAAAFFLIKD